MVVCLFESHRRLSFLDVISEQRYYSLSRKTLNTREISGMSIVSRTNQMRDEIAKDNEQTAAGISHDLMRNNEVALSSTRNLQCSLGISLKKLFFAKLTLVT